MAEMKCNGSLRCAGIIGCGPCSRCGFNPAEQERRLREGHFVTHETYHALHNDYGRIIHALKRNVKTLVFKKGA